MVVALRNPLVVVFVKVEVAITVFLTDPTSVVTVTTLMVE